jgi:PKD repeat protein
MPDFGNKYMKQSSLSRGVSLVMLGLLASCTMKDQEAPSLTGPSEFGKSINISVSPDVLQQDGRSQSVVTITARGPSGEPLRDVPLRAEIRVNGTPTDFGKLSASSLRTNGDGRAILTYTAPLGSPFVLEESILVDIAVTPTESDFGNASARSSTLRLVAIGIVLPKDPDKVVATFTFSPNGPTAEQTIFFDASGSSLGSNNPITTYSWDFGDGERGSGRTTTHSYDEPGDYLVTLTISDAIGRSAVSLPVTVKVVAGDPAHPTFTFSPIAPAPRTQVNFNASESTPGANRRIVSYSWDFGDGTPAQSGIQTAHTFVSAGTYTVTLTVTDDLGRPFSTSTTVPVK